MIKEKTKFNIKVSIALIILIGLIIWGKEWSRANTVEYLLNDYSCEQIKESVINGEDLKWKQGKITYIRYSQEEIDLHYRYRCS